MDDFREWLSDNLRYFMLGGAILIVLLILVFGIRACNSSRRKADPEAQKQEQNNTTDEKKESSDSNKENDVNQMEKANADITALIEKYYTDLGAKDVDSLSELVDSISSNDVSRILNATDYIERYEVNDVYVKAGMDEKSNVIYAAYHYYCKDISTPVPALSQFYVSQKEDGSYKINGNAEKDTTIKQFTDTMLQEPDVRALTASVKKEYDEALERDEVLKGFLKELSEEMNVSESVSDGTILVASTDEINVRETPDGDIIGQLYEGEKIEKLGEQDGWIKIEYEGQEAYVFGELFEVASE